MDPRTRMIIFKLLNQGFFKQIDGCLSTGKEANVYYAQGSEVILARIPQGGLWSTCSRGPDVFDRDVGGQ